MMSVDNVLTY